MAYADIVVSASLKPQKRGCLWGIDLIDSRFDNLSKSQPSLRLGCRNVSQFHHKQSFSGYANLDDHASPTYNVTPECQRQ